MARRKGLLFSLMVFILLSALLSLHSASESSRESYGEGLSESYAFRRVSDRYTNINKNISDLSANEAENAVDSRILPFAYGIDGNRITISSEIPVLGKKVENYLETLNAFGVFLEDTNYQNEFDSMRADINTLEPPEWGGSDRNVSFTVQPQCMEYSITDANGVSFAFPCVAGQYAALVRQDINISLSTAHDFNSLACTFNGANSCPDLDFNAASGMPYISIAFDGADCPDCSLVQNKVRGHYDPAQQNRVLLTCFGALCTSDPIDINFSTSTLISHSGTKADMAVVMDFNSEIRSFGFSDVNIQVADDTFGSARWGG
ncbi:MAG TPA: hypothetical protein VJH23_03550 [archaeon]|nr:hypothetical protein [archaeon]